MTFSQSLMQDSCTFQAHDFVGKPEDLYLWRYSGGSKTVAEYYSLFNITCDWDAGIRISETKSKLLLEATGAHDKRSHLLRTMHEGCCARSVGGFKSDLSEYSSDSADDTGGFPSFDSRLCTHVLTRRRCRQYILLAVRPSASSVCCIRYCVRINSAQLCFAGAALQQTPQMQYAEAADRNLGFQL